MLESTRQWSDYIEVDDVRRKFSKCGCGQNKEGLFYIYEQKPGKVKRQVCLLIVRNVTPRFGCVWRFRDEQ